MGKKATFDIIMDITKEMELKIRGPYRVTCVLDPCPPLIGILEKEVENAVDQM